MELQKQKNKLTTIHKPLNLNWFLKSDPTKTNDNPFPTHDHSKQALVLADKPLTQGKSFKGYFILTAT